MRDYIAKDHSRIAIEADEESTTRKSTSAKDGSKSGEPEDFAARSRIARSANSPWATSCWWKRSARNSPRACRNGETPAARIVIYFQTEGEIERFREIMGDASALTASNWWKEHSPRGFCFPAGNLVVLSAAEIFGRVHTHGRRRLQRAEKLGAQSRADRLQRAERRRSRCSSRARRRPFSRAHESADADGGMQEVLALEFADDAKLYVPLEQAYLVSRYVGVGKKSPPLSSLADARWARAQEECGRFHFRLRGQNARRPGGARNADSATPLAPDTKWQSEFEHSFPFRETAGSTQGDRRDQARHGTAALDGSADLRRCRLWQNGGGDSRRFQSGHGRQTGRGAHADDGAGAAAFRNLSPADARLPGARSKC